jgi:hypothetical protein
LVDYERVGGPKKRKWIYLLEAEQLDLKLEG